MWEKMLLNRNQYSYSPQNAQIIFLICEKTIYTYIWICLKEKGAFNRQNGHTMAHDIIQAYSFSFSPQFSHFLYICSKLKQSHYIYSKWRPKICSGLHIPYVLCSGNTCNYRHRGKSFIFDKALNEHSLVIYIPVPVCTLSTGLDIALLK